jgi:hypothetical protein
VNAGGGLDGLVLADSTQNLEGIRGLVRYNAGAGGGNVLVSDNADTTGDTAHLTATTLGAFPGDNLFGPGGSLEFHDLVNFGASPGITLNLSSGADTIYAQPLASARVTINAGNPVTAPGDVLNLALAAAQNYTINGAPSNGSVTSTNLSTLTYSGFESGPNVDDVPPVVVLAEININGIPGFAEGSLRRQSLDVQFSEDVSALISPAWLELMNLTTSQPIPASNIAVSYDTNTNTAHFTFPGYANGVLPDGSYAGKVLAGLPDVFGNGLPGDVAFEFFFLNGDANHDGRVNLADFNILAGNFGGVDKNFNQGDFNYDGVVNLADFNILASRFGTVLTATGLLTTGISGGTHRDLRSLREQVMMGKTSLVARFSGRIIEELDPLIDGDFIATR